jgi:hypothetical protein
MKNGGEFKQIVMSQYLASLSSVSPGATGTAKMIWGLTERLEVDKIIQKEFINSIEIVSRRGLFADNLIYS